MGVQHVDRDRREYVETEKIGVGARIATLGVDYGEGFAIGKPALLVGRPGWRRRWLAQVLPRARLLIPG